MVKRDKILRSNFYLFIDECLKFLKVKKWELGKHHPLGGNKSFGHQRNMEIILQKNKSSGHQSNMEIILQKKA